MSEYIEKCPNCGYLYSDASALYYSIDFARHIDHGNNFMMMHWCYNCNHIIVYRTVKVLGLIPLPFLAPQDQFDISIASTKDIIEMEDSEIGGPAISHLMRSIWWSFLARAERSVSEKKAPKAALREMISKLPAKEAALCLLAVSDAHLALPLNVQIERGKYLKEHRDPRIVLDEMLKAVSKIGTEKAQHVLSIVKDLQGASP